MCFVVTSQNFFRPSRKPGQQTNQSDRSFGLPSLRLIAIVAASFVVCAFATANQARADFTCSGPNQQAYVNYQTAQQNGAAHVQLNMASQTCSTVYSAVQGSISGNSGLIGIGSNTSYGDKGEWVLQFGAGFSNVRLNGVDVSDTYLDKVENGNNEVTFSYNNQFYSFTFNIVGSAGDRRFGPDLNSPDSFSVTSISDPSAVPDVTVIYFHAPNPVIPHGSTSVSTADRTDFGTVAMRGNDTHFFKIRNDGTSNLTTGSDAFVISDTTNFRENVTNIVNDVVLVPGETLTFGVQFKPESEGTHTATVTINTDDPDTPQYTFQVQGVGEKGSQWPFTASATPTVVNIGETSTIAIVENLATYQWFYSTATPVYSVPDNNGVCTIADKVITGTGAGTCTVTVTIPEDVHYNEARNNSGRYGYNPTQTITFDDPADRQFVANQQVALSATGGGSGNPVVFTSTTTDVCTISGSTATVVKVGTCSITANQAAGSGFLQADPVVQSFVISKGTPTLSFMLTWLQTYSAGGTVDLSAATTTNSTGSVTYTSQTTDICTIDGTNAVMVKPGTCTIQAAQAEDENYLAPTAETAGFQILAPTVIARRAVANTTLPVGDAATAFTPISASGGYGTLTLAVTPSLPDGLSFNTSNGEITGTPTTTTANATIG